MSDRQLCCATKLRDKVARLCCVSDTGLRQGISVMTRSIDLVSYSRVEFSWMTNQMYLVPVGSNPRLSPAAILEISYNDISRTGCPINFLFDSIGAYCQQRANHIAYRLVGFVHLSIYVLCFSVSVDGVFRWRSG